MGRGAKVDKVEANDQEIAALKSGGSGNPDPAKFVPVETVEQLRSEVAALRSRQQRQVEELVQAGLNDGRILPAQEGWAC